MATERPFTAAEMQKWADELGEVESLLVQTCPPYSVRVSNAIAGLRQAAAAHERWAQLKAWSEKRQADYNVPVVYQPRGYPSAEMTEWTFTAEEMQVMINELQSNPAIYSIDSVIAMLRTLAAERQKWQTVRGWISESFTTRTTIYMQNRNPYDEGWADGCEQALRHFDALGLTLEK